MKYAIIGAGISGLSSAQILSKKHEVTIFERESSPGGLIRCKRLNAGLFHTCGGHVFNSRRSDVLDWFWKHFDEETEFIKARRNSAVFMDKGTPIPYPIENHIYLLPEIVQIRIIKDYLQIAQDTLSTVDNFEDFLKARFGNTLYTLYFKPYNEKIWKRNLKNVPLDWLEGKLPMPSIEEILFNNINHKEETTFVHSSFFYPQKGGSQFIANRLAENLNVRYNQEIKSIESREGHWTINNELFDRVIFCGNIKSLPAILKNVDLSAFQDQIHNLEYHGTTTVFCEIAVSPYSWIYLPDSSYEGHRIICTGNFSTTNNAPGKMTATVEFTDYIDKESILQNLKRMPLHPTFIDYQFNEYTYPIQNVNTRRFIHDLKAYLASSGFYMTGRFADWEYYNMDAAIGAAMDLTNSLELI